MKLYYSPGACSLSPHIVLCELGLPHETEKVDLKSHTTAGGADFYGINPKGYIPVLQMDNGERLTEGPAIVQFLADQKPAAGLLPAAGTLERARVQEWLNFIGTELHKNFSPLFNPTTPDETKASAIAAIGRRLEFIDKSLGGKDYLTGNQFTVADAYLFTIVNWTGHMGIDLAPYTTVAAFQKRVGARPAVQQALKAEGLI
ncbi:glutathione transferase GstA [Pseudomonas akapageensis]|uniref:glutathione transferase GstA n=1 Tax=Pseudomonas akapageensis TaxID=2609961 RepID=UPI00140E36BB|nr:glutathione transferase GstA [Pseudomonas akapageensis]